MDLTIIEGGSPKKIDKKNAAERLSVFVQHMRSLEQSISMLRRMAEGIEWSELTKRANANHKGILDTLSYVKHYQKQIIVNLEKKNRIPNLRQIPGGLSEEGNDEQGM